MSGTKVEGSAKSPVMPFGKFKDRPISKIDTPYLEWVLGNVETLGPDLRKSIEAELQWREDDPSLDIEEDIDACRFFDVPNL